MSVTLAAKRIGKRYTLRALLACAVLAQLPGCSGGDEDELVEVRPVRVITIADRASNGSVTLTGTVQAQTEINQSFRIDGRLIERMVDIGDSVKPGQLVARLDPQNEESSLQSARAQLTAARAQLVEARANHARMRDLVAQDAVPRASFDQALQGRHPGLVGLRPGADTLHQRPAGQETADQVRPIGQARQSIRQEDIRWS